MPQRVRTSEQSVFEWLGGFCGVQTVGDTHLRHFAPKNVIILQRDKVRSVSAQVDRDNQEVTVSQHE